MIPMKHVGDGVVIIGRSGARYTAARGEVIKLLPVDAEGLADHPEWEPVDMAASEDADQEGDNDEHS